MSVLEVCLIFDSDVWHYDVGTGTKYMYSVLEPNICILYITLHIALQNNFKLLKIMSYITYCTKVLFLLRLKLNLVVLVLNVQYSCYSVCICILPCDSSMEKTKRTWSFFRIFFMHLNQWKGSFLHTFLGTIPCFGLGAQITPSLIFDFFLWK